MGKEEIYLLKDLMICKKCGNKISPHKVRDIRYYQCRGYKKNVCSSKLVNAEEIENRIKIISRAVYDGFIKDCILNMQPDLFEKNPEFKDKFDEGIKTIIDALISFKEIETSFFRTRISKLEYDIEERKGTLYLSDILQNITYKSMGNIGIKAVNFGLNELLTNEDFVYFKYVDIQKKE